MGAVAAFVSGWERERLSVDAVPGCCMWHRALAQVYPGFLAINWRRGTRISNGMSLLVCPAAQHMLGIQALPCSVFGSLFGFQMSRQQTILVYQ